MLYIGKNKHLRQSFSSDPSEHSVFPEHCRCPGMHSPLSQVNWSDRHSWAIPQTGIYKNQFTSHIYIYSSLKLAGKFKLQTLNRFIRTIWAIGITITQPCFMNAIKLVQASKFVVTAVDKTGISFGICTTL